MNVKQIIKLVEKSPEYEAAIAANVDVVSFLSEGNTDWMSRSEAGVISKAKAMLKRCLTKQNSLAELVEKGGQEFNGTIVGSVDRLNFNPDKRNAPPTYLMITDDGGVMKFDMFGDNPFAENAPCKVTITCVYEEREYNGETYGKWKSELAGVTRIEPISGYEFGKTLSQNASRADDKAAIEAIFKEFDDGARYATKIIRGAIRYVNGSPKFFWDVNKRNKYDGSYGMTTVDREDRDLGVLTNGMPTFVLVLGNDKSPISVKVQLPLMNIGAITTCVADFDVVVDDASQLPTVREQLKDVESGLYDREVVIIGDVTRAEQYQVDDKKGSGPVMTTGITITPYGIFEISDTSKQQVLSTEEKKSTAKKAAPIKVAKPATPASPSSPAKIENAHTVPELIDGIVSYAASLGQEPGYFSADEIRTALPKLVGNRDNTSVLVAINSAKRKAEGAA